MKIQIQKSSFRRGVPAMASAGLACLLFSCPPVFLARQTALADVVRGEAISGPTSNSIPAKADSASEAKLAPTNIPPAATASGKQAAESPKKKTLESAGFDRLSGFQFKVTDEMVLGMTDPLATSQEIAGQIPDSIKALNEKEVSITGFMMPLMVHDGKAIEFLILKSQATCCYGTPPGLNDYVSVHMSGNGVKPVADRLVTISGILHVGEIRQNRVLTGIYRMDGDKMVGPSEP